MKEVRDIIAACARRADEKLALATLVRAHGSSYRRAGARMLIAGDRSTVGVLSGGCLEEEVAECAQVVITNGRPQLLTFDTRLRYGCNGSIEVFIESEPQRLLRGLSASLRQRQASRLATIFEKADSLGSWLLESNEQPPAGAFVQAVHPQMRLLLIGSGPDSEPLRKFGETLGWEVIEAEDASSLPRACDKWTAAIVKTHNYGRDYAALVHLLPVGLRYVGLLGPRRRRDQLFHALADEGVSMRSELFAPSGLDVGAESPEEIALAMITEIQATFAGRDAESLRERRSPIHEAPPQPLVRTR